MLKFMRRNARSIFIQSIFFIIIVVFIFWGIGTFTSNKKDIIARIDDTIITQADFLRTYQLEIDALRKRYGEAFSDRLLEELNLKERVLNRLIDRAVILKEAKRMGLGVSKEEVLERIKAIPAFQRNGVFDKDLYISVLRREDLFPSEFEEGLREDILIEKAMKIVTDSIKVTDDEVRNLFRNRYRRLSLRFVRIDYPRLREGDVTEEEAKKYFESHKETFRLPERLNVNYVVVESDPFVKKVKVKQEEIKTYYEKNRAIFEGKKKTISLEEAKGIIREILKNEKAIELARREAEALVDTAIKESRPLAEVAGEKGFKVESTGPFSRRELNIITTEKALWEAVSSLKVGEVSNPVRIGSRFYVLQLKGREEARIPEFEEVKEAVRHRLLQEKAKTQARKAAEEALSLLKKGRSLKAIAQEKGWEVGETGFFSRLDSRIPVMGLSLTDGQKVFTLGRDNPFIILKGKGSLYVAELLYTKPPDEDLFQKKRAFLRRELLEIKKGLALNGWLKGLKERTEIVINREAL